MASEGHLTPACNQQSTYLLSTTQAGQVTLIIYLTFQVVPDSDKTLVHELESALTNLRFTLTCVNSSTFEVTWEINNLFSCAPLYSSHYMPDLISLQYVMSHAFFSLSRYYPASR